MIENSLRPRFVTLRSVHSAAFLRTHGIHPRFVAPDPKNPGRHLWTFELTDRTDVLLATWRESITTLMLPTLGEQEPPRDHVQRPA